MNKVETIKKLYYVFSVIMIILGAILLINPTIIATVYLKIFGVLIILFGIVKIISYFSRNVLQMAFQNDFAMGIISCLVGVIMVLWSQEFITAMTFLIAMLIIIDALLRMQTSIEAKKIGFKRWWVILLVSLIIIAIGILLFLRTHQGAQFIIILVGLEFIVDGILNIYIVHNTVTIVRRFEWDN